MTKQEKELGKVTLVLIAAGLFWALMSAVLFAADVNMDAIKQIESSGNPLAHNKAEDGRGLFQINPICLKEYNNYHSRQYSSRELFEPAVNTRIAIWYMSIRIPQMLKYYKVKDTVENRLIAWNAGISSARKGRIPTTTRNYIKKYYLLTKGAR